MDKSLLSIENLQVEFSTYGGRIQAVRGISFSVEPGECVAVVGESGCGKSVTAKSILRLLPQPQSRIRRDSSIYLDDDLKIEYTEQQLKTLREQHADLFSLPEEVLDSIKPVGEQISFLLQEKGLLSEDEAKAEAILYFEQMRINRRNYQEPLSRWPKQERLRLSFLLAVVNNPMRFTVYPGSSISFDGQEVLDFSERQMQHLRGDDISMIFQDPMTSLNPTMTVGKQISEVLVKHQKLSKAEAKKKTIDYLQLVGIANPEKRYKEYPNSLSGGMRQRVMIAIAMCCNPKLLIADEPTTALDVTIQAQILDLMRGLQSQFNTAIILITHDLGVVANMAQRVLVFYAGQIIEEGKADDVFYRPRHPYTWGLIKSMPKLNSENKEDLVSIEGVPPDLFSPPKGCAFAARCDYCMELCLQQSPSRVEVGEGHYAKCWLSLPQVSDDLRPNWLKSQHVDAADYGGDFDS